jgi:polygalacturonase
VTTASTLTIARAAMWDGSSVMSPVVLASTLAAARTALGLSASATTVTTFATRTLAVAATIDAAVLTIITGGYAASGDMGGTTYKRVGSPPSHSGKFQSADGAWWEVIGPVYNWRAFGAVGDGVANDSAAIQGTIDAAQLIGGVSFGPPGSYKLSTGLSITGRVLFQGVGFEGSVVNVLASTGYKSTTLVCATTITCISVNTPSPVILEKFQITYPSRPTAGTAGILLDAPGGGTAANVDSVIRYIQMIGPDIGIKTINAGTFLIDRIRIDGAWQFNALLQWVNVPGSGDSVLTHCIFSSGSVVDSIVAQSSGGLRIINNKINHANQGNGIAILPNLVTAQAISPLFICNNSIEGTVIGVLFQRLAGITEQVGNVIITGNEIFGTSNAILMQNSVTNPTVPWVLGGVISGNFLMANSGGICIVVAGAQAINVVGNQLYGSGSTGIQIDGTSTNTIGNNVNNKGPGVI